MTHQRGHLHVKVNSRAFPFCHVLRLIMCREVRNPAQRRVTRNPCMFLISQYHLFSWTIMLSPQSPRSISRLVLSMPQKTAGGDTSTQNHAILHSFLSNVVEEFLVRNSFTKPPPQVQPREEPAQKPRKRRRLADHMVSVYSPGPSQQSYRAAELDYLPQEQEFLQPCCSECSSSCDGCSSCCEECLHARQENNPDPDHPEGAYYSEGQLDPGECSLSDEVFDTQVSMNLHLSHGCLSGLGGWRGGMDGPDHWGIFHR